MVLVVGLAVALSLGPGVAAAANTVAVDDVTASAGDEAAVVVTLDGAPDGLQRYNVTVGVSNADVATVESASAGDVEAFQVRSRAADSITFRAADLSESVEPGASNVTLGTVTLSTRDPGTAELVVTVHDFRTDEGEPLQPSTSRGTLAVERSDTAAGDLPGGSLPGLPGPAIGWAVGAVLVIVSGGIALRRRRRDVTGAESRRL